MSMPVVPPRGPQAEDGPALELSALRKGYIEGDRTHVVLDGVDAVVERGQRVAILGPSGSGKSSLVGAGIVPAMAQAGHPARVVTRARTRWLR